MENLTIRQLHEKLQRKEVSAKEITESFLRHSAKQEVSLHAFITQTPELALQQAEQVDEKIAAGEELSLLAGIPCAVKDSILVKDVPCTAASKMLEHYIAPYDATAVQKLRACDMVFVGKTNTDEFSMGSSTENSAFGPTKNPHDQTRVPGGTSGGSAAAVAGAQAQVALGADTGGSIRLPAAFCGTIGLKPTYGAVSRYGLIATVSSLDQIGPLAKTADDAELVFEAISGRDEKDATSIEYAYKKWEHFDITKLRVGVPKEYFAEGLHREIEKKVQGVLHALEEAGARLVEVSLPHTPYALAAYYILNMSEISSNLARYDGIRYGESKIQNPKSKIQNVLEAYLQTRGEYLGAEVKRRIILGTYALSAGYYEAYYLKAQKIRALLTQDFQKAFEKTDVLIGPVSPFLPFKIGERVQDPLSMYLVDVYTVPANLAGLPSLALPAGNVGDLPVGMQIMGKPLAENLLFAVAKELEK